MNTARLAAVALGATLLVSGCGSGRLDSGELTDKVKAACNKAHVALEKIPTPRSATQVPAFVGSATTTTATLMADLKRLKPPEDLQQDYSLVLSVLGDELEAMQSANARIRQGSDPIVELRSLTQATAALQGRERIAWQGLDAESCFQR